MKTNFMVCYIGSYDWPLRLKEQHICMCVSVCILFAFITDMAVNDCLL